VLPASSVTLSGTGTDEDGTVASYQWTNISGPTGFTIVSPNNAETVVNNLVKGTYQFQLKVTDNKGITGTDLVTVSVTENAIPNSLEGMFINGSHATSGLAKINTDNSGNRTLSLENFRTDNGPDLYVYVAKDRSASVFVSLGRLQSFSGNQTYSVPSNVNFTQMPYVLIWCKAFGVLFGSAQIK
jgi:Electron transfer DM13